ncbi:hypothetical protein BGX27_005490 [Mortierella sp. AM989]|nr:hypothetical protein BGX27_005490 [Mortierella sp. AM989]
MSQLPTDHQWTQSTSNNNPYLHNNSSSHSNINYSYNNDNNSYNNNNNNSYDQFQEGHIPAYAHNADWNQYRDPTKQSTGSVSSFKSWTSEDPAYSTQTSSFNSTNSPLTKPPRSHHTPPRGESLSMASNSSSIRTSSRYQNNSNLNSINSNIYNPGQGQHNNGYDNNHSSYTSQSSVQNQSYGDQNYPNQHHISSQQQYPVDKVLLHQQQQQQQQQNQESRMSQRAPRRRDPSAGAGDDAKLPSLDDYEAMLQQMTSPKFGPKGRGEANRLVEPSLDDFEAMLQQMTSPTLGPKDPRSAAGLTANRRQERESREPRPERAPRQTRRQQLNSQQGQQQPGQQQQMEPHRSNDINNTDASLKVDESFDQKKLRRRSSLPSKLKETPNLFSNTKRLSNDSHNLSPSTPKLESPKVLASMGIGNNFAQQSKRFSWENESIAPRVDLLEANKLRPGSLQRKNSWQELEAVAEHQSVPSMTAEAPVSNYTTKPKQHRADPNAVTPPQQARPLTPNSRSRPSTPIGGIKPPPGPAPPSAAMVPPPRTASPKPGKRPNNNISNSSSMLQPFVQGSRPRASSSASVSSLGSMNGLALDRVLTPPPPPSSPLPSLPPPPVSLAPYQTPPSSQPISMVSGAAIGLGIGESQTFDQRTILPTPASSVPISPELNAVSANQAAHMARLKKRVSLLEKELANAESELSTRIRDGSELQSLVDRLTAERDSLENLRLELAEKDKEIFMLRAEQERSQGVHSLEGGNKDEALVMMNREIEKLSSHHFDLEQELNEARNEIQRLQDLALDREHSRSEVDQAKREREEMEQQIKDLMLEKAHFEESYAAMEREVETLQERLQQETTQYSILQDSVQRLSTKMARLETQHANELQQLRVDHDDILEKTLQEHDGVVRDLIDRHREDTDAVVEHAQRQMEDSFFQERAEAGAREKVLRDRIDKQINIHDGFEEELFKLQDALEAANKEKDTLDRTSRSLERHVSMQRLQEEENLYRIEELKRENSNLREVLSHLDVAAATQRRIRKKKNDSEEQSDVEEGFEDEEEGEEQRRLKAAETFEEQQRKWNEQAKLMARKLARAEEEARETIVQNENLRIALELAQSQSFKQPSTPTPSSRTLSSPLSA